MQGKKRFQMTSVSYIINCNFTMCLSGVLVDAGIQKLYPHEYFLNLNPFLGNFSLVTSQL